MLVIHLVIRASAGSGKTTQLSNRYIGLLHAGASPRSILGTTFTRKAAQEILDRILKRLATAAADEQSASKLSSQLEKGRHAAGHELDLERVRALLRTTCRDLDRISISTLDAFFNRMAGKFRHELGVPAEPMLVDENSPDASRLRAETIEALVADSDRQVLLSLLRDLEKDDVKRSVIASFDGVVSSLYENYRQSDQKAWNSLKVLGTRLDKPALDRLAASIGGLSALADSKNFRTGIEKHAAWIADENWDDIVGSTLFQAVLEGREKFDKKVIPAVVTSTYQPLIEHCRYIVTERLARQTRATYKLLARFDAEYSRLRRINNVMLFSDLPLLLGRDLRKRGDDLLREIYYRLDATVEHLLLDEFQDTSLVQWEVLKPIARSVVNTRGAARSFFCVGDVKQAIYGWRGGCSDIFERIEKDLKLPEAAFCDIAVNFRSSPAVLTAVNEIFSKLADNPAFAEHKSLAERWQKRFEVHRACDENAERPGYVELTSAPADEISENTDSFGAAALIERLHRTHPGMQIGVLTRDNKHVHELLDALRHRGVAASGEGGNSITDDPAITRVLAALTLADHPGDSAALYELSHSPLAEHVGLGSLDSNGRLPPELAERASLEIRNDLVERGYADVIAAWARALAPFCNARSVSRLEKLIDYADAHDARPTLRPCDFVAKVQRVKMEDASGARVRVMTVHGSKGLEFDIVVLAQLDKAIGAPHKELVAVDRERPFLAIRSVYRKAKKCEQLLSPQIAEAYAQENARRLDDDICGLYVAMTRAEYALHMIVPPLRRSKHGGITTTGWSNLSWATVLRRGLSVLGDAESTAGGEILFRAGDPDWRRTDSRRAFRSSPEAVLEPGTDDSGKVPRRVVRTGGVSRRSWRVVSPSKLHRGGEVSAAKIFKMAESEAQVRGNVIHRWLAEIETIDAPEPDELLLVRLARELYPGLERAILEGYIAEFRTQLAKPAVRGALSPVAVDAGQSIEIWRERRFAVREAERLVTGAFDRVVLVRDKDGRVVEAMLVDWKTGHRNDPPGVAEEEYRPQMEEYLNVLMMMLSPAKADYRLVFLDR